MNGRGCVLVALLLTLGVLSPARGDDAKAADDLRTRAKRYQKEVRDHHEAVEKAKAERAADLAAQGIHGVATLGPKHDPSRSVDVVFLGDGFTEEEMGDYEKVIERMARNFDTPPFDAHRDRLNLYRVDLASAESGITRDGKTVATRLGGTVAPFPGGKLLRCDTAEAARLARLAVPEVDYLMVVLNTHGKFLGSANSGAIVLLSTAGGHQRSIVVHEFAHNFGGLYDEYVDPKQAQGRPPPKRLEQGKNVGLEPNVHAAKWHYWNIPEDVFRGHRRGKSFHVEDNVRCYEGAATFPDDVYRPEENCHMQRGRGKAFCRACRERLELALCRFYDPVEEVGPARAAVRLSTGARVTLSIRPVNRRGQEEETIVRFYVDGQRVDSKSWKVVPPAKDETGGPRYAFEVKGARLGEGRHQVTATVDLRSPRVRMDLGRLSASYTWTVEVGVAAPTLTLPETLAGDVGEPITFTAEPAGEGEEPWQLLYAPEGAVYDEQTGAVEWTPEPHQRGAYTFTFAPPEGRSPLRSVTARVRPAKKRPNRPPKPIFTPPQRVKAGETIQFVLMGYDPDTDHLAWSIDELPAGASLNANDGTFRWKVGPTETGTRTLAFTATDGRKRIEQVVPVTIEGIASFRGIFRVESAETAPFEDWTDRLLSGLHHPQPRVRLANARALNDAPSQARMAEALRLLRETHAGLHTWASETLEGLFEESPTRHLSMFLDAMPSVIWQFADRPADRVLLRTLIERARSADGLTREDRKALDALAADLDMIEAYGKERLERDPVPPITDKKYR